MVEEARILEVLTLVFMGFFVTIGIFYIGLSMPLIRRQVKPGSIGCRTAKTLSSERAWYDGNAYAGRIGFRVGMVLIVVAIALYLVLRPNFIAYITACSVMFLGMNAILMWLTLRYLRSL